ncbi:MAG: hypothetical protein MUF01_06450 [Bryobacterales bacterium]|jgi:hypothetical protein|nr:hypothetical protein [Bryobacterales bacterium]
MATFSIWRLRDSQQDKFRWAPQQSSATTPLKLTDYREDGSIDAEGVYEAWLSLRKDNRELRVGDVLAEDGGKLFLCKYVGLEPAEWVIADMDLQVARDAELQAAKGATVAQQENPA